jgi:hypothetical protein
MMLALFLSALQRLRDWQEGKLRYALNHFGNTSVGLIRNDQRHHILNHHHFGKQAIKTYINAIFIEGITVDERVALNVFAMVKTPNEHLDIACTVVK